MLTKYDVWKWLDDKERNYYEGVQLLEGIMPNQVLLPKLKEGVSFMNRKYLDKIMKQLFYDFPAQSEALHEAPAAPSQPSTTEKEQKKDLTPADYHRIAEKELARAYATRRNLSNQFHLCKSNKERANLSDRIKDLIKDIGELKARINVYKETGYMPPKVVIDKSFKIPKDAGALAQKINNYRTKISNQKLLLKNYDAQPRRKSKENHELRLQYLIECLKQMEDERDARS